jgi:regulator of cell morphogenesis and NO signaling
MNPAESPTTQAAAGISTVALADLDTATLIATIVARYHRVHSQELPELIQMAERVETVHQGHAAVPAGLAALLKEMLGELTMHMQKEELILFPHMSSADAGNAGGLAFQHPIAKMMAEHEEHGACLERIRKLTNDFRVPDDGCGTWRALYAGVAKFADDLVAHVHTENTILFPRFLSDG